MQLIKFLSIPILTQKFIKFIGNLKYFEKKDQALKAKTPMMKLL